MSSIPRQRILVTGNIAYDLLLDYGGVFQEALARATTGVLSVSFEIKDIIRQFGGTGANIAWNLRLLKQDPLLVASVGSDSGEYLKHLTTGGVDTSHIEVLEKYLTATGVCCTDGKQNQFWFFCNAADSHGTWPDLSRERTHISYGIVAPRNPKIMLQAMRWCAKNKIPAIFDPGQEILRFTEEELKEAASLATGIICNTYEWDVLSSHLKKKEENLIAEGLAFLIITKGSDGHTQYRSDGTENIGRCDAASFANPTGAGDAFRAGLLTGLTAGWSFRDSGRLGAALASFVVELGGTLLPKLDVEEMRRRAKLAYGEDLPPLPR
jgi:adenosine kinase